MLPGTCVPLAARPSLLPVSVWMKRARAYCRSWKARGSPRMAYSSIPSIPLAWFRCISLRKGAHRFDIRPDQAYDHIHPRLARIAAIAAKPELVYFGTLAQRADSHRALRHMLRAASGQRFFDVNLRNPWVSTERLHWSLKHADIMKANDAELELINLMLGLRADSAEAQARLLMQQYSLRGVLITRGAAGAWWLGDSGLIEMSSSPISGYPRHCGCRRRVLSRFHARASGWLDVACHFAPGASFRRSHLPDTWSGSGARRFL